MNSNPQPSTSTSQNSIPNPSRYENSIKEYLFSSQAHQKNRTLLEAAQDKAFSAISTRVREEREESDRKRKAYQSEYERFCLDMIKTFTKMSEDVKRLLNAVEKCNKARQANSDLPRHPFEGRVEQLKGSIQSFEEVIDVFEACVLRLQNIPRKTSGYIDQLEKLSAKILLAARLEKIVETEVESNGEDALPPRPPLKDSFFFLLATTQALFSWTAILQLGRLCLCKIAITAIQTTPLTKLNLISHDFRPRNLAQNAKPPIREISFQSNSHSALL